jgi:hypothetical protein
MHRRIVAAFIAMASAVVLLGCRPNTVELGFDPEIGATYRYRYAIHATVIREVEGEAPRTTRLSVTVESIQTVVEQTGDGTLLEVTVTSSASPAPSTATVVVDRAGSLQAIQQIDGLPGDSLGLPNTDALLAAAATETPNGALAVGGRWDIAEGSVTGDGRLDRLGVLDGEHAAVTESVLVEVLDATQQTGGSEVVLDGDLHTSTTTAFDLVDGSVREGRTRSRGTVEVLVAPPAGVLAPPVEAIVSYDLRVTTTRLDSPRPAA